MALAACDQGSGRDVASPPTPAASPPATTQPSEKLDRIDLEGLRALISDAKEKKQVLVLEFWATWCPPCVEMFAPLHEQTAAFGDRVRLVSITIDDGDTEAAAIAFLNENHARRDAYMLVPDTDARFRAIEGIAQKWKDLVVPAILIYDSGGNLAAELVTDPRVEAIVVKTRELLASTSSVNQP